MVELRKDELNFTVITGRKSLKTHSMTTSDFNTIILRLLLAMEKQ